MIPVTISRISNTLDTALFFSLNTKLNMCAHLPIVQNLIINTSYHNNAHTKIEIHEHLIL